SETVGNRLVPAAPVSPRHSPAPAPAVERPPPFLACGLFPPTHPASAPFGFRTRPPAALPSPPPATSVAQDSQTTCCRSTPAPALHQARSAAADACTRHRAPQSAGLRGIP